jgi:hypothetical protein
MGGNKTVGTFFMVIFTVISHRREESLGSLSVQNCPGKYHSKFISLYPWAFRLIIDVAGFELKYKLSCHGIGVKGMHWFMSDTPSKI